MISTTHNFFKTVDSTTQKYHLLPPHATIILGLSGGPDSMFLLHYLCARHRAGDITLIATHLDHEWRATSANDVEFCEQQTSALGIKFISSKISKLSFRPKFNGSKEDLGRLMRRHFFELIREQEHADLIALAHQMQDQQETFFIRMIRGSSLAGLTAIKPRQGNYIRPLIETNRTEILAYLDQNKIPYLIDPSNESDLFLRNRIRNKVLPILRTIDCRFDQNFARTLVQLKETDEFLNELTLNYLLSISTVAGKKRTIDTKKFNVLNPVLKKRILVIWLIEAQVPFTPTEKFLHEIELFLSKPVGKTHQLHATWSIEKKKSLATINKQKN
jgi:tRNA(Ile)-lysidine synthase